MNVGNQFLISIHAPRTGSDQKVIPSVQVDADFNPRSPHGERRLRLDFRAIVVRISIHAPRTGSDTRAGAALTSFSTFQSTLPARGATRHNPTLGVAACISIHAPRTGSDPLRQLERRRSR